MSASKDCRLRVCIRAAGLLSAWAASVTCEFSIEGDSICNLKICVIRAAEENLQTLEICFPHIYMWYIYISYSYSFPSPAVQCVHSTFSFWSNVFHNWRQESKVFFSYTVMKIELLLPWFSKHQLCLCACVKNRGERRVLASCHFHGWLHFIFCLDCIQTFPLVFFTL